MMDKELDAWIHLHSPWQFSNLKCTIQKPDMRHQNTNSVLCVPSMSAVAAFPGACSHDSLQQTSALAPPMFPPLNPPQFDQLEDSLLFFDKSRDRKSFIFSLSNAHFQCLNTMASGFGLQGCTRTSVSEGQGCEEMHEDTEEINALLYSDSDDDEETSTGHSPVGVMEVCSSEVASSMHPAKRRRLSVLDADASLPDCANSAVVAHSDIPTDRRNKEDDGNADSSCIKGHYYNTKTGDKRLERARIQETIHVLRRIIPGAKGNDAATVLNEAICYLRSLKLKVKSLNTTPY